MSGGGTPGGRRLGEALVRWFEEHKRALPWRQNRDPYRVWVAEVMLQQTRVDTVAPRYVSFLRRFPSVEALAAAGEDEVLKEWEGLGYYSRARNLRLAAREIVNRYGGRFPDSPEELRRLPGIGRYTAAAVASIAFNRPAAAVDGNVLRVMARLHGIDEPVTRAPVQRRIERLTEALIPPGRAADFTEALMELGALVCTPGQPDCGRCPWRDACTAYLEGRTGELPVRPQRTAPRVVHGAVAVVTANGDGARAGRRVLVVRRPAGGLLAGMWEFPWVETAPDASEAECEAILTRTLRDRYGLDVVVDGGLPAVRHVFSHLEWRLQVFAARVRPGAEAPAGRRKLAAQGRAAGEDGDLVWAAPEELDGLAFGRAHRRIADTWRKRRPAP